MFGKRGKTTLATGAILTLVLKWLSKQCQRNTLDLIRIHAARMYLVAVQHLRTAVMHIILLVVAAQLFVTAFIVFHIAVLWAFELEDRTRFIILAIATGLYTLAAVVACVRLLSQRFWMDATGARNMVESATRKREGCSGD